MATKVNGLIQKVNPGNDTQYSIASTAYGYCETVAATAAKVVDMTGFTLLEGTTIHVKFKENNTAANPTLNVNGTGAKPIVQYGTTAASTGDATTGWYAGAVVSFTYDGTSWVRDQGFNADTHWTTHLYAGDGTAANKATTNGNTKISVTDNSTVRNSITVKGSGTTSVISDANGVITISSADSKTGTVTSITPGNGLLNGTTTNAITTSGTLNINYGTTTAKIGTAAAGSATTVSRSDHVHAIDLATGDNNGQVKIAGTNVSVKGLGSNAYTSTAYAPLASPALTGTPTAPTAATETNTTQIATTAFVKNVIAANDNYIPKDTAGNTQQLLRPLQLNGLNDVTLDAKINDLRANRLAFLPADQIIIEKTTDGGTTWADAGISDSVKVSLFSETRPNVTLPLLNGAKSVNCGLRITFTAMKYNVPAGTAETQKYNYWNSNYIVSTERYNQLKEMYFWVNANTDTISVKAERATGANSTNWIKLYDSDENSFGMTGWSGSDYIRFSQGVFGGGTTQTGNYWNYRLTFFTRGPGGSKTTLSGTSTSSAQGISEIRGYGDTYWTAGNNYAASDHLYSHDASQNATFPAKVTATGGFSGNLTGNADTATKFASNQSVTLTGDVTGSASSQAGWSIATTLANSGVTANTYGDTSQQTPSHGGTFNIPYFKVDAKGRVTQAGTTTVKLPADSNTDTKVTQNNTTAANDYRILLSTSANDTAETNTINKSTNLRYNPSTNTLSTGNITGAGNLDITGNANLNGETYIASANADSLLVSGNANFVQIPTAPTPDASSNDTSVATTAFVTSALTGVSSPMRFIGSLGTGGTATSLPAASAANQGYTYKVITANTYQGVAAKVGDVLVSNGSSWVLIPSGDEPNGTVTSITLKAGDGITLDTDNTAITSSGTRTISHKDTSSVSNLTANGRKYVTGLTFDTYGHVTGYTTGTETVTNSDTKNTAGSTDTSSKIYLIGATSQADNPQTYSDNEVFATSGVLTAKTFNSTSLTASQAVSTDANKNLVSTNLTVSDPTAGTSGQINFIATISQSAQGKITATKQPVRSASTTQTGVTQYTADNLNTWINQLGTGSSTPVDADYYISQYVGGGTTTTTYHRRPMSALWSYVKGKITAGTYWANIKISDAAAYNAAPEMATLKLNGNTSATTASTSNVSLVFNTTTNALDFIFA